MKRGPGRGLVGLILLAWCLNLPVRATREGNGEKRTEGDGEALQSLHPLPPLFLIRPPTGDTGANYRGTPGRGTRRKKVLRRLE
jgi:hypothetical protein